MNILYYDCFAGISGDMNLAAMIGLGVDVDSLRAQLSLLGLDHEFDLRVGTDVRHGIHGTRVDVDVRHDHAHGHHHGRTFADIERLITTSALPPEVRATSLAIFRRVAEAEARVHGQPVRDVHFHEVGAVDSIVDIVGAAICRHSLQIDTVWASPLELGGGFAHCAHGLIPVPAPATTEILHGIPTTRGRVEHEATTPTGAAIIATLAEAFPDAPALIMKTTAYGIGHRDGAIPNVLRVHLARPISASGVGRQQARLLQCNIDDMTGEALGVAMDLLMDAGAMDVHFTPIQMKKNRPATCLSLLCAATDEDRFLELIFHHTTTLGVKSIAVDKTVLQARQDRVDTPLGPVTVKRALRDGRVLRSKPELEDCRSLAMRHGLSLHEVGTRIAAAIARDTDGGSHD